MNVVMENSSFYDNIMSTDRIGKSHHKTRLTGNKCQVSEHYSLASYVSVI